MDHKNQIRALIAALLEKKGDQQPFSGTDSLVLSGRLDSIDVIEIVSFLEQNYGVDFGDIPFDQSMVDSVDEIAALAGGARVA